MRLQQLEPGSWYLFTDYARCPDYCKYMGQDPEWDKDFRHLFHFLDGQLLHYCEATVQKCMTPCSKIFSEYLDLFRLEEPNEEVL